MKSTFRILFYVKRDKQKLDGTLPIMCRITINGEAARFFTKVNVNPEIWDSKAHIVIGRSREANEINTFLNDIRTSIHNVYHELLVHENTVSAEKVKNTFFGHGVEQRTLLEVIRIYNDDIKKLIGISKSKLTYNRYELIRVRVSKFINEYYNVSDIPLKDFNYEFIHNFHIHLMITYDMGQNTVGKFLQRFHSIITMAKNNGWIQVDPFANFKIKFKKTDRGYLTQQEIYAIREKKFSTKRLERVRDIFIFSCFTGLSYIDVKNLRKSNIRTFLDEKLWIMSKRQKSDVTFNIPLLDIPKQILDKYDGTLPGDKVLPIMSNQKMNEYLKEIGDLCGINKDLTFHLARHTFATFTLTKGVPIESVSKMLGHTSIQTTQIYARILDDKVCDDMASFEKKLESRQHQKYYDVNKLFENLSVLQKFSLIESAIRYSNNKERQTQLSLIRKNMFSNGKEVEMRVSIMWNSFSMDEKTHTIMTYMNKDLYNKMDFDRLFESLSWQQRLLLLEYSIEYSNNVEHANQLMIINWKKFSDNTDIDELIFSLWNSFSNDEKAQYIRRYFDHVKFTNQLHEKELIDERRTLLLKKMYEKEIV